MASCEGFDPCIPCLTKAELKVGNQRCGAGGATSPGGGLTVRETRTFISLPCSLNTRGPIVQDELFVIHFTFFLIMFFFPLYLSFRSWIFPSNFLPLVSELGA